MSRLSRVVRTLRLSALFFSVPYTLLWARALHDPPNLTGWLIVALHACALLLTLALLTRERASRGREPAFMYDRDALALEPAILHTAIPALALACVALLIALTPAAVRVSLAGVILLAVGLWQPMRSPRGRMMGVEALAPFVVLIAPALLLGERGWTAAAKVAPAGNAGLAGVPVADGATMIPASVVGATLLGGACMGLYLLLCMARDAAGDRHDGVGTTATKIGPGATRVLARAWLIGAVALSAMGAAWGWWGWAPAAIAGVGAMWVAGALASEAEDSAVRRWWLAHAALSVALAVAVRV